MKKIAFLLIAGMLCMSTVPVCAASVSTVKASTKGSDASGADYTRIPSAETLQEDIGFVPRTPDRLAGDFLFESGNISESYDLNQNGDAVNRRKGISFRYISVMDGSTKSVTLSAEMDGGQSKSENQPTMKYREVDLYFEDTYANSISWTEDGIGYILMDTSRVVTEEELVAMAKGMLDIGAE